MLDERYTVLEVAGEGGMGLVYRVRDALHPGRSVALKTLSPSFVDVSRAELLKAEFRTMSELSHPNIARVHDFERIAGTQQHAFTMEFVDGRDLLTASEGQPLESILDWVVEACRALRYLHSRGVVHADFKPHNVLVTRGGQVKVLDFGLSGVSGAGLVLGTPAYMAPELRAGVATGVASDLYAVGITLYQLVFGRLPFTGDTLQEVSRKHVQDALPFPEGGGEGEALRGVITRLSRRSAPRTASPAPTRWSRRSPLRPGGRTRPRRRRLAGATSRARDWWGASRRSMRCSRTACLPVDPRGPLRTTSSSPACRARAASASRASSAR